MNENELLITKDKKEEWIRKNGGEEGLKFLEMITKELSNDIILKEGEVTEEVSATNVEESVTKEVETKEVTEVVESTTKEQEIVKENSGEVSIQPTLTESMQSILKAYTGDVIQPLYDALWKIEDAVSALIKENNDLKTTLQTIMGQVNMQKQFTLFETVPTESFAHLIKQRTTSIVDALDTAFTNKADETLIKSKPVENKNKVEELPSMFTGFLEGK